MDFCGSLGLGQALLGRHAASLNPIHSTLRREMSIPFCRLANEVELALSFSPSLGASALGFFSGVAGCAALRPRVICLVLDILLRKDRVRLLRKNAFHVGSSEI